MLSGVVFLAVICGVSAVAEIDIAALANTDFSAAAAAANALGDFADGSVVAAAGDGYAYSAATATAVSDGKVKVKDPKIKDKVKDPKYKDPKVNVFYPVPKKTYPYYYEKCGDLYDDKCYDIDTYSKCGFCYTEKTYPIKGYACKYYEKLVKVEKIIGGKAGYDYEYEYYPECDCDGKFIFEAKYCPSCDLLLAELLECAGYDGILDGEIEIPKSCIDEYIFDDDYLYKCDFFDKKDEYYGKDTKPIYYDPEYYYVKPKKAFAEAFATAKATAIGGGIAEAFASAFAGDDDK